MNSRSLAVTWDRLIIVGGALHVAYVAVLGRNQTYWIVYLSCSKCCSAELSLRVGLIHAYMSACFNAVLLIR